MSAQLTPLAADIRGEAFPRLTAEQIDRIRPVSKVRKVEAGEILFEPGDSDVPFFVLLSGSMEIVHPACGASASSSRTRPTASREKSR
jgi:CRP-like cAMP-binding protein